MKLSVFILIIKTIKKRLWKLDWTVCDRDILAICYFYDIVDDVFNDNIKCIIRDGLNYYYHSVLMPESYTHIELDDNTYKVVNVRELYKNVENDKELMNIQLDNSKVREILQIIDDRIYNNKLMSDNHKDNISYLISQLKLRYIK